MESLAYRIIQLGISDLDSLLALDQLCYGGLWGKQGYLDELQRDNSTVLGATDPLNHLIGFGILWRVLTEAHIISLAVDPQVRRRGVGQTLLQALLEKAVDQGCEWATLEVRASNQIALALYEKVGFRILGSRKRYYADTGEDALILWKQNLQSY